MIKEYKYSGRDPSDRELYTHKHTQLGDPNAPCKRIAPSKVYKARARCQIRPGQRQIYDDFYIPRNVEVESFPLDWARSRTHDETSTRRAVYEFPEENCAAKTW